MRILLGWDMLVREIASNNPVLTVGSFDGVHCGHQILLQKLLLQAKKLQAPSLVLSFQPHPRLFFKIQDFKLIYSCDEKIYWLENLGIDFLGLIPFDQDLASLSAIDFMKLIKTKLNPSALVVGRDHSFGLQREGGLSTLYKMQSDFAWQIHEVEDYLYRGVKVSSSAIRKALLNRDIVMVNALLGRAYSYSGTVVKGNQNGRKLGFPTANIMNNELGLLCPPSGVYVVNVQVDGEESLYMGMLNIGLHPTLDKVDEPVVEVHILHFDREIYGAKLRLYFYKFLRGEQKFPNIKALIEQLYVDRVHVEKYFDA